ncbi:M20/M25/M40 family metallo-hydrolase [Candidatus Thorarchaeota archaeon]|nr:MAG: M20/M25/M40 family metallo-hydrolase [Candidatus Thorarchaeota archaeon]
MAFDVKETLEALVSFETTNTDEKKSGSECPKYILSRLEDYGFRTELIESEGYYSGLGEFGEGEYSVLFLAHFDVVPVSDNWEYPAFEVTYDSNRAYGRGTCDDKGNIVSLLNMAKMISEGEPSCITMIGVTGDEEIGGRNGAYVLQKKLLHEDRFPDYVIIADGLNQDIINRRRNILPTIFRTKKKKATIMGTRDTLRFETETFGTDTRHSAYLRLGVDRHAMLAASKYMDLHSDLLVTNVRGAFVKSNVVPDWVEMDIIEPTDDGEECEYDGNLTNLMRELLTIASTSFPTRLSDKGTIINPNILEDRRDSWKLHCDIRAMTNDAEEVKESFERNLKDRVNLEELKVHAGMGYVDSDPSSKLIGTARKVLEELSIPYAIVEGFGASDSRYFAGHGSDVFDFGPRGDNLHGPNEWVWLPSLDENARFYHQLVKKIADSE